MSDLLIPPQKSPGVITPTVTYTAPPVNPDAVALTGTQIVVLANWDNRRSNEAGIADQIRLSIGSANSLFVVNGVTVVALTQATSTITGSNQITINLSAMPSGVTDATIVEVVIEAIISLAFPVLMLTCSVHGNTYASNALLSLGNTANMTTDGTLAEDSDELYPSEKAVKTYVDAAIENVIVGDLGYQLASNLTTDITLAANSNILYPSEKAVKAYADGLASNYLPSNTILPVTIAEVGTKFLTSYTSTTGSFAAAQPTYTDISGLSTVAHTGAYGDLSSLPQLAVTKAAVGSYWLSAYNSTTGVFSTAQPTFSDLSSHPTTLSGYGITDANKWASLTGDLTETQLISFDGVTPGTPDTLISRSGAGIIALGTTGSAGDYTGSLKLTGINNQGGQISKVNTQTGASYTPLITDYYVMLTYSGAVAVTLNSALAIGTTFKIKNKTGVGNNVTLTPSSGNIEGAASLVMSTNNQSVEVVLDASGNWNIF
jgi:hypothetical protein